MASVFNGPCAHLLAIISTLFSSLHWHGSTLQVPTMSVTHKCRYPPKPPHLPALNPVEERLITPRLPFINVGHLTHASGQYGIKGLVLIVEIDVANTALDAYIMHQLVNKPSYRNGLTEMPRAPQSRLL